MVARLGKALGESAMDQRDEHAGRNLRKGDQAVVGQLRLQADKTLSVPKNQGVAGVLRLLNVKPQVAAGRCDTLEEIQVRCDIECWTAAGDEPFNVIRCRRMIEDPDVVVDAGVGFDLVRTIAREENHPAGKLEGTNLPINVESVHDRHMKIEEYDGRGLFPSPGQGLLPGRRRRHTPPPGLFEQAGIENSGSFVVVDEEKMRPPFHHNGRSLYQ